MKHQPRVDPLITELIGGVRAGDNDIAPSMVQALAAVCASAGKNIGPGAKASIVELVEEAFVAGRNGELEATLRGQGQRALLIKAENYNKAIGQVVAGLAKNDAENIRSIAE
jgi:hypothetical protein